MLSRLNNITTKISVMRYIIVNIDNIIYKIYFYEL